MNMNLVRAVHLKKEVLTFTGFMFEIMIMIILFEIMIMIILILTFIITVIS
jgi:hypothetical protein